MPANFSPVHWSSAIILVDMNAFFASIEQLDHPEWRGKPLGVTNGRQGSCLITCSYEARAWGVKTGMRLKEARRLCPDLIQCPAQPKRYAAVSRKIMRALTAITPDVEVFSVDEAFLEVTRCQRLHGTPLRMGRMVKEIIWEASGLPCSVGISGDKTTAKYAAKLEKPDGLTVIPPWASREVLASVPVTALCGIAEGIGGFLARHGVHTCGDMPKLPVSVLAKRFGDLGRRIWLMCQGSDPTPVSLQVAPPKSVGHGKVMPPGTQDERVVFIYLKHMAEKVAQRLRRYHLQANAFKVGLRSDALGWIGGKFQNVAPTHDGQVIYTLAKALLSQHWSGEGVSQIQLTALEPVPRALQRDLFLPPPDPRREGVHAVIDGVNARYGEFTLAPACLLGRSSMPNAIAPAWQPEGLRNTI